MAKKTICFFLRQTEHINQALKTIDQLQAQPKTTLKQESSDYCLRRSCNSLTTKKLKHG